jgi:4-amino-4-deoxy-L-arabinose transferase-like glycosyltransferase
MLAGHVLLFGAALIVFVRAGRRHIASWPDGAREELRAFLRGSPGIALFAAAVGLLAAANLVFPFLYPPLNGDANAYHLPRAYYWMQLGSARHFPTVDFRMNEMPPNASFVFAWILALSGGFSGLHVPQWTSGLALAAATAALARLAGAARAVALFTGVLALTWPLTILQMGSSQTDLLVAAAGVCAVFFGLRAMLASRQEGLGDLAYFGLAFGLAAGTKLTFVFLLPVLAIALSVLAASRRRLELLPRAGVAAAIGFAAFGAYNYALNLADFGRPAGSRRGWELLYAASAPWQLDQPSNALRYLEQTLDWPGLVNGDGSFLVGAQDAVFSALARILGRDAGFGEMRAPFLRSRWVPDEGLSGFGPVGFLAVVISPVILALALRDFRNVREPAHLVEACFVLIAVGWSVAFLLSAQPWSGQLRFFLVVVPLVSAAAIPRLTQGRRRVAVVAAAGVTALVVALAVTVSGPSGIRRGDYRRSDFGDGLREEVMSSWTRLLPEMYPRVATLGLAPEFNDTVFHLFRSLPRFRFLPVAEEEITAAIAAGRLDGALTGQFRNEAGQGVTRPGRPLPRSFLHPREPDSFFRSHPDQYRLRFVRKGAGLVAICALPDGIAWDPLLLHLRLPSALVKATGSPTVLVLTADRLLRAADEVRASCGMPAAPAAVAIDGSELRVAVCPSEALFVDVQLSRSDSAPPATFRAARLERATPPGESPR